MAHIVIIGGSYAGTKVAHKVLKDIPGTTVTLVDPSEVFYFNIASPRIIAKPNEVNFGQFLIPITEKFKKYPSNRFKFIRGLVSSVDTDAKTLEIDGRMSVSYDFLVVASGSTTPGTVGSEAIPFKPTGGNDIRQKIEAAQQRVAEAESIVIVGAGPVGVEMAGEVAQAYPGKTITLISSHDQVLPWLKTSAAKSAEISLRSLGVKILYSTRVIRTERDISAGKFKVHLQDGFPLNAALVVSATGNIPNTNFMPSESLDSEGWIVVDQTSMSHLSSTRPFSLSAMRQCSNKDTCSRYKTRFLWLSVTSELPSQSLDLLYRIMRTTSLWCLCLLGGALELARLEDGYHSVSSLRSPRAGTTSCRKQHRTSVRAEVVARDLASVQVDSSIL